MIQHEFRNICSLIFLREWAAATRMASEFSAEMLWDIEQTSYYYWLHLRASFSGKRLRRVSGCGTARWSTISEGDYCTDQCSFYDSPHQFVCPVGRFVASPFLFLSRNDWLGQTRPCVTPMAHVCFLQKGPHDSIEASSVCPDPLGAGTAQ